MKRDLISFLEEGKQRLIDTSQKQNLLLSKKQRQYPKYLPPPSREESIIYPPQKSIAYTQQTSYVPGVMNPVDIDVLSTNIIHYKLIMMVQNTFHHFKQNT